MMKKLVLAIFLCLTVLSSLHAAELQQMPGLFVGSEAPDFTATTHEGQSVILSDLIDEGPVVLIFYRGVWCPYCNLHLRQFQSKLEEFDEYGVTLLGVSVDMKEYADQTVIENGLGFQVLSDPNTEILESYNLIYQVPDELEDKYKNQYGIDLEKHSGRNDHVIAVPATYVINEEGVIIFGYASHDYKVRTSPDEVLQVLETL